MVTPVVFIVVPATAMFAMSLAWHLGGSISRGIVNVLDNLTTPRSRR